MSTNEKENAEFVIINNRNYPYNLLTKVFGEGKFTAPLSKSQEYALLLVVNSLDKRAQYVLKARYIMGRTFEEIGVSLNISKEAVASIDRKNIRKLRHPVNATKIEYGIQDVPEKKDDTIEAIGLSIRAYNALKRGGINNVSDIKSIKQLNSIRTIGKKIICEIQETLSEKGISIK